MPQVGDEIQLVSCGEIFGQQACNVFYFTVGLWTGNLTINQVLGEFLTKQDVATAPFRSSLHTLTRATWRNLTDTTEQGNLTLQTPKPGSRIEEGLPPNAAISIQLRGVNNSTRRGYKRLAGVVESQQSDGMVVLTQPLIDAATAFFGGSIITSVGDELDPVIIGRNVDGSLNLAVVNPIDLAILQPAVTTQNSRKFGRGS